MYTNEGKIYLRLLNESKFIYFYSCVKTAHYKCFRSVTENNDWENYILYMLDMIEVTSVKGLERLNKITTAMEKTAEEIKKKLPKIYSKDLI